MSSIDEVMLSLLESPKRRTGGRSSSRPSSRSSTSSSVSSSSNSRSTSVPSYQETGGRRGEKFSEFQVKRMTEEYNKVSPQQFAYDKRVIVKRLSSEIGLSEKQIATWFTNRKSALVGLPNNSPSSSPTPTSQPAPLSATSRPIQTSSTNNIPNPTKINMNHNSVNSPANTPNNPIKKELKSVSDTIEIIELDEDDEVASEETLLNESLNNSVVELTEFSSESSAKSEVPRIILGKDSNPAPPQQVGRKGREQQSKDETISLLMDQVKELEKYMAKKTSPEVQLLQQELVKKNSEIESLKKVSDNSDDLEKKSDDLEQKLSILKKEYDEKVLVLKSFESKIPKMIEDFTKYVEDKEKISSAKEKELNEIVNTKDKEIEKATENVSRLEELLKASRKKERESVEMAEKKGTKDTKVALEKKEAELRESKSKFWVMEAKQRELIGRLEESEKDLLVYQEKVRKMQKNDADSQKKNKEVQDQKKIEEKKMLDEIEKTKQRLVKKEDKCKRLEKDYSDLKEKYKKKEKKDLDIDDHVKAKQDLESKLKDSSKKISALEKDLKNIEVKQKADLVKAKEKQQADLVKAREDLTNCQIRAQKLTSLNNDFKHQYEELNKLYLKTDGEKKSLLIKASDYETKVSNFENMEKEMAEQKKEITELKSEMKNKEDKESKLLEVLVNRGDQIRAFKAQDKDKDYKTDDLRKSLERKTTELAKFQQEIDANKAALVAKTKEIDETNSIIQQFKLKLSTYDAKIQDNVTRFMDKLKAKDKTLQDKTKEMQDKNYLHKKEIQKVIIDCNEKMYSKDQLLKEKALEHGRKIKEKVEEYEAKLKAKDAKIFECNQRISEKVLKITEKADESRKKDIQISEITRKLNEKLKDKDIEYQAKLINSQNNIRNEMLGQQINMKKIHLQEMEDLRASHEWEQVQFKLESRVSGDRIVGQLKEKLEVKKSLIRKMKSVMLYRPQENINLEVNKSCSTPTLMLSYNWPLLHLRGSPNTVLDPLMFVHLNRNGEILLSLKPSHPSFMLPRLQSSKRKREKDDEDDVERECKRLRITSPGPMLMLTYSWPLVPYSRPTIFSLASAGEVALQMKPFWAISCLFFPQPSLDNVETELAHTQTEVSPPLMLTYSWPIVLYTPTSFSHSSIGSLALLILPALKSSLLPNSTGIKRKSSFPAGERRPLKKRKVSSTPMLSYLWPIVHYTSKTVEVDTVEMDNLIFCLSPSGELALAIKPFWRMSYTTMPGHIRETEVTCYTSPKKQTLSPHPLMLTYSWPLVSYPARKDTTTFCLSPSGDLALQIKKFWSILRNFFQKVSDNDSPRNLGLKRKHLESTVVVASKKRKLSHPLMLSYSWPIVSCPIGNNGNSYYLTESGQLSLSIKPFWTVQRIQLATSNYSQKLETLVVKAPTAPLMLTYSWPVVPYTAPLIALSLLVKPPQAPAFPSVKLLLDSLPLASDLLAGKRLSPSDQEVGSCKRPKSEIIWPIVPATQSIHQIFGQKRKREDDDAAQDAKRARQTQEDVLQFSFYTYKVASPPVTPVTTRCLATPGLCCPTLQMREVSSSLFSEVEQDLLGMSDEAFEVEEETEDDLETESYFGDFDLPVKFTRIPRQISLTCLQRPGLCERQSKYIHTSPVPDYLVDKLNNC